MDDVRQGPSPAAITAAEHVAARLTAGRFARTSAPVRRRFIERSAADAPPPPLARMLRGGRGGMVRLKLELSMLWLAARAPHELIYPARAWAVLLDLPDPEGRGARRIQDALRWLEENRFVDIMLRLGQPSTVQLRSENGDDKPYELPGQAYNRLRNDRSASEAHRYIQLPNSFWTNGWLATLSGPAVAMLLVLYAELGQDPPATTDLWFSPRQADLQYALSEDTRSKGLRELRATGLIDARQKSITPDVFDFRRLRNVYRLIPARLEELVSFQDAVPPIKSPSQAREEDWLGSLLPSLDPKDLKPWPQ